MLPSLTQMFPKAKFTVPSCSNGIRGWELPGMLFQELNEVRHFNQSTGEAHVEMNVQLVTSFHAG